MTKTKYHCLVKIINYKNISKDLHIKAKTKACLLIFLNKYIKAVSIPI